MISINNLVTAKELESAHTPVCLFAQEDGGVVGAGFLAPAARKQLFDLAKAEAFKGSLGECAAVAWNGKKYVLVGLGKKKDYNAETLRRASGSLFNWAKGRLEKIALAADNVQAAAEGLLLASYKFEEYKKADAIDKLAEVSFITQSAAQRRAAQKDIEKASLYAEAVCFVRDLVNRGPSDKTPQSLAKIAQSFEGVKVNVIEKAEAKKLGMGAFLGVARGSAVDPVFVHLIYAPKGAKRKIGLVGKGITFDSGGLSLKPPAAMETMKMDMAGAASVLAVMKALPRLKPKVEVHGFCAFTYNMPGPDAVKPGDVVKAMNGKTIEILNTDAEGRLILADALVYATRQKLDSIVDLATLTGAVIVALGSKVTAALGNDTALMRRLFAAASRAQEDFCELPLPKDYQENMKSSIADLANISKIRGEAGTIMGGLFLQEFVDGTPWAHLDIAGTAWSDRGCAYCPAGGTGSVVRALLEYVSAS